MCKATGKKWNDDWRNKITQEFVATLNLEAGIPASGLVQVKKGEMASDQGTEFPLKLAMHSAQWCNPKFAVVVSGWVLNILTTEKAEVVPL